MAIEGGGFLPRLPDSAAGRTVAIAPNIYDNALSRVFGEVTSNAIIDRSFAHGKPAERLGRKATGLSSGIHTKNMAAGLPSDYRQRIQSAGAV